MSSNTAVEDIANEVFDHFTFRFGDQIKDIDTLFNDRLLAEIFAIERSDLFAGAESEWMPAERPESKQDGR